MEPSPRRAPDELPRAIRERARARMLLALRDGWEPLPTDEAWVRLDAMAARFDEGLEQFTEPAARGFYAALNDDPDLAEAFELLAEDAVAPAVAVPAGLAARLAAIPRGEPTPARPTRELSFLRAYAHEVGVRIAELRDKLTNWQPGAPLPASALAFRRGDAAGAPVAPPDDAPIGGSIGDDEQGIALQLLASPDPAGHWRLTVRVRSTTRPVRGAPPPVWIVAAQLPDRDLCVDAERPGIWRVRDPLTAAELAEITVRAEPAAGGAAS